MTATTDVSLREVISATTVSITADDNTFLLANGTGQIIDNLTGDGAGSENISGTTVTLSAPTGIGSVDAIDTNATNLDLASPASTVSINQTGLVTLDNVSATTFNLTAGGQIDDDNAGAVSVSGTATVVAGAGNSIFLNAPSNDFGTVVVDNGFIGNDANDVELVDQNSIVLGATTIAGNLDVTADGTITQSGVLTVGDAGIFETVGTDQAITLANTGNSFGGTVDFSTSTAGGNAGHVSIARGVLDFSASNIAGNLTATAQTGTISQSGALTVAGNAAFTTSAADQTITLTDNNNVFGGTVAFSTSATVANAGHVSIVGDVLNFATSGITGSLTATARTGAITQTGGPLTVTDTGSFETVAINQVIDLSDASNAIFGAVDFTTAGTTGNVTFDNGTTAVELATSTISGSLNVTTGNAGGIIDVGPVAVANGATFTTDASSGVVDLDQLDLTAGQLVLTTDGTGSATVVNTQAIDFGPSSVGGALSATATLGTITQTGGALTVGGNAAFTTAQDDQAITLANTSNSFGGTVAFTTNSAALNNGDVNIGGEALNFAASTIDGNLIATARPARSARADR